MVTTTVNAASPSRDAVAVPMPSHGERTAVVSRVNGSGPAMVRTAAPITCGGGPPEPSRNEGKNSSSPTACADLADGSSVPSSTPSPTKPTAPISNASATRQAECRDGSPYTGVATISSSTQDTSVATSPTTSEEIANDQRGKPATANRRSTPRSRYEARGPGSIPRPTAPITTVR